MSIHPNTRRSAIRLHNQIPATAATHVSTDAPVTACTVHPAIPLAVIDARGKNAHNYVPVLAQPWSAVDHQNYASLQVKTGRGRVLGSS